MGLLKKIFKPVSKVLDKIIPNEVKPFLPYAAAFAPYLGPMQGIMGIGGNTMLTRALMSGALNIGSQLAQEGSEGDINLLSAGLGALQGAMTTPGAADKFKAMQISGRAPDGSLMRAGSLPGDLEAANALNLSSDIGMLGKAQNVGLDALAKGSGWIEKGMAGDWIDKAKVLSIPGAHATGDLMYAQGQRDLKDLANDVVDEMGEGYSDDAYRAAIRKSMTAYGATEEEIIAAIEAAGYRSGGRVGLEFGGIPQALQAIEEKETQWLTKKPEWKTVKRDLNEIFQEAGGLEGDGMNAVWKYVKDNDLNYDWLLQGDEIKVKEKENSDPAVNILGNAPVNILDSLDGTKTFTVGDGVELIMPNSVGDGVELIMPTQKANGGRVGMWSGGGLKSLWNLGKGMFKGGDGAVDLAKQEEMFRTGPITVKSLEEADDKMIKKFIRTRDTEGVGGYGMYKDFGEMPAGLQAAELISRIKKADGTIDYEAAEVFIGKKLKGDESIDELIAMVVKPQKIKKALGGRINKAEGGMPSVLPKGIEADYRGGGFIPIGSRERADDVPARLSENEFVMTADAVRAAGGGSVNRGAKRMYDLMHNLEARA